jgi:disulfide bond formation protein DsbB
MSEVLGWLPCLWCWYQRILMYPQAVLLAVGLARRDTNLPRYMLWLAIPGILASLWHIGLQKVPQITLLYPCKGSVPCSSDALWQLGIFPQWVTIPMLALVAFATITVCCVIALRSRQTLDEDEVEGLSPLVFVLTIVVAVVLLFGVSGAINVAASAPKNPLLPEPVASGGGVLAVSAEAAELFTRSCAGCHQPTTTGYNYMRAAFVGSKSEAEIVTSIKTGRDVKSADNFSGQAMPAYGGQLLLTDEQLLALARHVKGTVR